MKRLIQKENAKQVGILYHFTSPWGLVGILNNNTITLSDSSEVEGGAVSFTRNKNFFHDWHTRFIGSRGQCRITIDGDLLSEHYKIQPYNEYTKHRPRKLEQEEIVKREISPIIPYIIEVSIFKNNFWDIDIEYLKDELDIEGIDKFVEYISNNFGIKVNIE